MFGAGGRALQGAKKARWDKSVLHSCTHFLATDTSRHVGVAPRVRRQECARGVQGVCKECARKTEVCKEHPGRAWGARFPPGRGWAHLAGISSFISSPINSQIGCHHRLSIHHFGGREALGQDLKHQKITLGSN